MVNPAGMAEQLRCCTSWIGVEGSKQCSCVDNVIVLPLESLARVENMLAYYRICK